MKFYIQSDIVGIDSQPISNAALSMGHIVIPFKAYDRYLSDDAFAYDNEFIYGSVNEIKGSGLDKWFGKQLDFDKIYARGYAQGVLYQEQVVFLPWSCVRGHRTVRDNFFLRPNSSYKTFNGTLIHGNYYNEQNFITENQLDKLEKDYRIAENTLCVCAKTKKPYHEFRTLVVNKRIVASTRYNQTKLNKHWELSKSDLDKSQKCLDELNYWPFPAFIADFAVHYDGPKLLELGSVHCAAIYDIEPTLFINEISKVLNA